MSKIIEVVFEKGLLKPLEKINLKEGEKLKVEIKQEEVDLDSLRGRYKGSADSHSELDEVYDRRRHID